MKTTCRPALAALAVLLPAESPVQAAGQGQPPHLTPIGEVVVYAVDADSYELIRYNFDTDAYIRVGVITDQNGNVVTDIAGLALIPHGPQRGLYGTANFHGVLPPRLVKINPLDATARLYPAGVGFGSVQGLVAAQDAGTSAWSLLGATADPGLITIDPTTGAGTMLTATAEPYRGLALDFAGTLYGVSGDALWTIDRATGDEDEVGEITDDATFGALEHAFGDFEPRIKVPSGGHAVVPDSWTADGIMFAYDVTEKKLRIINPHNAHNVDWACTLEAVDCEGLAFTTRLRDPYEAILGAAGD